MPAPQTSTQVVEEASDQEKDLLALVTARAESFEGGIGQDFKSTCDRRYKQYRGFQRTSDAYRGATKKPDQDEVVKEAGKEWGALLHIPMSFRTIETMVPRMIAQRPRMLVLPRQEQWEPNVRAMKMLIDAQQDNISIDLPFQAVARSGGIYGLGVGKAYWKHEERSKRVVRSRLIGSSYFLGDRKQVVTFDDPFFEDVDIYDFMWDDRASDVDTAQWMIHRVWLGTEQVLQRIASGAWATKGAKALDADRIGRLGGSTVKYDDVWSERMTASGFPSFRGVRSEDQPHEVLEYHDGTHVIVVLDRAVVVAYGENQAIGHMPFQVYRPIPLQKQMVGIGYLEPLEHLQRELDTLRSQRRDAATLALRAGYAYDESAVDEDDLEFGPGVAIPVTNQNPRDAIVPLQVRDVPGSSWQEEQAILSNFDQISGVNDDQTAGGQTTATGQMMSMARTSRSTALQGRRFEIEVARSVGRVWIALNQAKILEEREYREPDHGGDEVGDGDPNVGRFKWAKIGPGELRGEYEIVVEGGSMSERNVPQDRQDAVQMLQTFGGRPEVDQRRLLLEAIKLFGHDDPMSWLKQQEKPVPQLALQMLEQSGVPGELIRFAVARAQQQDPMASVNAGEDPAGGDPAGQEDVQMRPEAVEQS